MENSWSPGREGGQDAGRLAEVWGDTVDLRHLGLAMALSCAVSLFCFLLSQRLFPAAVYGPEIAHTDSLLGGLLGCLAGGGLSAALFRPKRVVVDRADDASWETEVIARVAAETGSLGPATDLPATTVREMKELGLFELFHRGDAAADAGT